MSKSNSTGKGIGIGAIIAIVLSWGANKSILYCLLHGLCGWFYVLYYLILK
jgi:hypothetical protein